jgi:hypothetical protein
MEPTASAAGLSNRCVAAPWRDSIAGVSRRGIWLFLAVALPMLAALLASLSSVDLTFHLRAGDEILAAGAIPSVDTWTFTAAGLPWFDQQWLSDVVLTVVYRLGGWTWLAALRAILVGVVFASLLAIAVRRGLSPRTAALLTLVAFGIAAPALALRAQLFGMVFFAVSLVLVTERRRHPAWLWAIPVLVVAWANIHGSFLLAPLILALSWLEDLSDRSPLRHRALVVGVVSAVTACVTPFGPSVWAYAVGLSTNPEVTRRITEWQPTSIRDATGVLFFASVAGVGVLIARRGRPVAWPMLVWLGVFLAIGLYAQRGLAWWPLAAVPVVAGLLPAPDATAPEVPSRSAMNRLNAVLAALVVLAGVALLPAWRPIEPATGVPAGVLTDSPPGLTAALREATERGDNVFNPQPWGSWLEFAVPEASYALDSRIEFFPPEVWDAYEGVVTGAAGWEERLGRWHVAAIVLQIEDSAFRDRLIAAGWTETYRDADGSVFVTPSRGSIPQGSSLVGQGPTFVERRSTDHCLIGCDAG